MVPTMIYALQYARLLRVKELRAERMTIADISYTIGMSECDVEKVLISNEPITS